MSSIRALLDAVVNHFMSEANFVNTSLSVFRTLPSNFRSNVTDLFNIGNICAQPQIERKKVKARKQRENKEINKAKERHRKRKLDLPLF